MNAFALLMVAIASELIATTSLKLSEGFTKLAPSVAVVIGYGIAFYLMSIVLKSLPVSVTYAIWSGLGTAGTAVIGVLLFNEVLDLPRIAGIVLVILGVVLLNVNLSGPAPTS